MATTVVKLVEGMKFLAQGKSTHPVMMDSVPAFGGSDSAARPMEVLLASLGGCTGMDVVSILRKMKTEPKSLKIEIEDERATEHPKILTKLHLRYYVTGEVSEANLKKAIDLSLTKYCPVANGLAGIAEITSSYVIEP